MSTVKMKANKAKANFLCSLVLGFLAGYCYVHFRGFFSANENYSPNSAFKDLDLSRTFHYSKCCTENCLCCIQGLSPMGCKLQDFRMRAQCSVSKWRIYTHWHRSAVLPVILCVPLYFSVPQNPCISQCLTFLFWYFSFTSHLHVSVTPTYISALFACFTDQTDSSNLENPCWFSSTLGQACRQNLPLNLGFFHSPSPFFIFFLHQTLLSSQAFMAACQQASTVLAHAQPFLSHSSLQSSK